MEIFIGLLLALASLALVGYVHRKIPAFSNSRGKVLTARAILVVVGVAFGLVNSLYLAEMQQKIIVFIISFGMVHVPAAVILFVKSRRRDKRS